MSCYSPAIYYLVESSVHFIALYFINGCQNKRNEIHIKPKFPVFLFAKIFCVPFLFKFKTIRLCDCLWNKILIHWSFWLIFVKTSGSLDMFLTYSEFSVYSNFSVFFLFLLSMWRVLPPGTDFLPRIVCKYIISPSNLSIFLPHLD